jgi:hypothetical protein
LLSNIYLHYVLDTWVTEWRKSKASGEVIIVRYADDCAPRAHQRTKVPRCGAARKMRDGPSEPVYRNRLQTTSSCMGKEPLW